MFLFCRADGGAVSAVVRVGVVDRGEKGGLGEEPGAAEKMSCHCSDLALVCGNVKTMFSIDTDKKSDVDKSLLPVWAKKQTSA